MDFKRLMRLTPIDFVNLAGIVIAVSLAVVLAQTIYRNYTLNRQIETLRGQIGVLNAQQEGLKYNIEYYKTDAFREREARSNLGLQKPGESVVVLSNPQHAAADRAKSAPTEVAPAGSNFSQWIRFLTGKG